MANIDSDELMLYHNRMRPLYPLLFGIAHLITGSADSAEFCVRCVLSDIWYAGENNAGAHGFRELLRARTIRTALHTQSNDSEYDWTGLQLFDSDINGVSVQLKKESVDYQRILALHYGCGFSPRRCAKLCHTDVSKAASAISRFERRLRRRLDAKDRRKFDHPLPRFFNDILSRPEEIAPQFSAVFRSFRSDAEETARPTRLPMRILRTVITILVVILCVAAFFLAAVLIQPAAVH